MITVSENAKNQAIKLMAEDNAPEGRADQKGVKLANAAAFFAQIAITGLENQKAGGENGKGVTARL